MTYITASEAKTTNQRTYRYLVELASNQLDYEGVPADYRIADVVVLENKLEAIKNLIVAAGWLDRSPSSHIGFPTTTAIVSRFTGWGFYTSSRLIQIQVIRRLLVDNVVSIKKLETSFSLRRDSSQDLR